MKNRFSVKEGLVQTRQLRGLFASKPGIPEKTYIMGHSMGGIVTLMAAEKNLALGVLFPHKMWPDTRPSH